MRKTTAKPRPAGFDHDPAILERRLDDGYRRIEEALVRGEDVQAWENFWIELLHQYEAAFDALPEIAE